MKLLLILFAYIESAELQKVQRLFDFEYSDNGLLNDMVNLKRMRLSKQLFLETQNSAHFIKLYRAFESHYGVDYNQLEYGNLTDEFNYFSLMMNVQIQARRGNFIGLIGKEKSFFVKHKMSTLLDENIEFGNTTHISTFVASTHQIKFPFSVSRLQLTRQDIGNITVHISFDDCLTCYDVTMAQKVVLFSFGSTVKGLVHSI